MMEMSSQAEVVHYWVTTEASDCLVLLMDAFASRLFIGDCLLISTRLGDSLLTARSKVLIHDFMLFRMQPNPLLL